MAYWEHAAANMLDPINATHGSPRRRPTASANCSSTRTAAARVCGCESDNIKRASALGQLITRTLQAQLLAAAILRNEANRVWCSASQQSDSAVRARGLSKFPVRPDSLPCFPLCSRNKFPVSASRELVLKRIDFLGVKARHTGVIEALFEKFPCIFPC